MTFFEQFAKRITVSPQATGKSETTAAQLPCLSVEIFVQPQFSQLELSSTWAVLEVLNDVQNRFKVEWSFSSDTPGLVANGNLMVRAEPAFDGDYMKDCLVVLGGRDCSSTTWIKRVRTMQQKQHPVVLFSDAATEYVKSNKKVSHPTTTHWRDIPILNEIGDYSDLSSHLAEYGNGIITSAGRGYALETIFHLVAELLNPQERAELASLLIVDSARSFYRDQPKGKAQGNTFLEGPLQKALQLMEETIEEPLSIGELTRAIGVSARQLERLFKIQLNSSPAKTYKRIRLKRARSLIVETRMSLLDIAIACGFSGTSAMSKAFRDVYGMSPNNLRK